MLRMTRTLTILLLLIGYHALAQCREAATLRTSKDFCLGSSLTVTDPHTMERIVWYKDGQPIDSVSADSRTHNKCTCSSIVPAMYMPARHRPSRQ